MSIILVSPNYISEATYNKYLYGDVERETWKNIFTLAWWSIIFLLWCVIPMCVIFVAYFMSARVLLNQRVPTSNQDPALRRKRNMNVIKMFSIITGLFVSLRLPHAIASLYVHAIVFYGEKTDG